MFPTLLLPLLHVGGPQPTSSPYTHWILDPKIAVAVIGITALYLAWMGPLNRRRPGVENRPVSQAQIRWFILGSIVFLISLGPPIDDWSHFFFVSAHMVQHLLLMFVVVPLWMLGIPAWVYQPIVQHRRAAWLLTWIPRAVPGFVLASIIMGLWHIPLLYDATLENELLHTTQHFFFLVAGFLFYWPLMSPVPESPRLSPPLQCLYLFAQTIPAGIVGAMITYAAPGLYPHYNQATIRPWGIDLKTDQEMAGLIMWVGMNTYFLVLITIIFMRWANGEERKDFAAMDQERERRRELRLQVPVAPDTSVPTSLANKP